MSQGPTDTGESDNYTVPDEWARHKSAPLWNTSHLLAPLPGLTSGLTDGSLNKHKNLSLCFFSKVLPSL